jgi:predicted transcriptional regulator
MPQIELSDELRQRITRIAQVTRKSEPLVIEEALASYGWVPAKGLGAEAARILLAAQGRDVMRIYNWVQDGVLAPQVVCRVGEIAAAEGEDLWLPACGGKEVVCRSRRGQQYLYCWNPTAGRHAYYLIDEDRFVEDLDEGIA